MGRPGARGSTVRVMATGARRTVIDGLVFGEGPRWHGGALWCSDIHGGAVHRVGPEGRDVVVLEPDDAPSGLGWLPDGSLLVVAMESQRLLRLDAAGNLSTHADLSPWARGSLNDMVVAEDGTAYVGDMGSRIFADDPDRSVPGQIFAVDAAGAVRTVADGLRAPNGMILPPGQNTLVAAESGGFRLLRFPRDDVGDLGAPTVFADLHPASPDVRVAAPDGICGDVEGAVWVADPLGARVIRVRPGGQVTDSVVIDDARPVACVLGGEDRRTLFVSAAVHYSHHEVIGRRTGRVVAVDVEVAGAGTP